MSFLNQLKEKAEELNRKHNLLPIGQNKPQQGYGASPQQYYPGQQPYPYQPQHQPQGQWQWQQPAPTHWQTPPPPPGQSWQQPAHPPQPNYNTRPGGPPPIPSHSKPPASPSAESGGPRVYWRPTFSPGIPVSHEFDHRLGHGDPWGWGNNELENYTSDSSNSFYTPDGKLVIRALSQSHHPDPEARYMSARLVSRATLGRRDGCVTAWLSLPCAEGIWPAFWLLPREPSVWPHEGEIDIAESWNGDCENHACLHWGFYTPEDAQKHLVRGTHIPDMPHRAIRYDFVWQCSGTGVRGDGKEEGGGRIMFTARWILELPFLEGS
ncbi:glycoside hydrolase family 16 protein [Xylaria bambusicola]|uniref:glycoside hydrolase family 16 protein n=1 Tax=Xylaria bambusicola TaxID=326684 RepID=UPI002007601B|nr:glycoside hydrolase family 16 protein [Xylaria bambusicola]KAI0525594.1 glycoside hydrolase family 16 protein [Xylaria bambusicola]